MSDAPPTVTTRLRKSNPLGKGYHRVRAGRGFSYRAPDGSTVTDPALRERFDALGIPPAWTDVWIAPYENGHIQAVGHDAANRKQYMYHPTWRERHDKNKYRRMLLLAEALPGARGTVRRHLRDPEDPRRQVLAAAFRMLDLGGLRIGSTTYEEANGSYGLTTLHGEHVQVDGDTIELRFPAKSHKFWESTMRDEDLAPLLAGLKARGDGERLLVYRHGDGWRTIAPEDVNGYVRERLHGEFSAKDFRTLRGTVAAAVSLAKHGPETKKGLQKRAVAEAMRAAAAELSNTPTVAKASYVDPRVVDRYRAGETIDPTRLHAAEAEVLSLLFERPGSPIAKPKSKSKSKAERKAKRKSKAGSESESRTGAGTSTTAEPDPAPLVAAEAAS